MFHVNLKELKHFIDIWKIKKNSYLTTIDVIKAYKPEVTEDHIKRTEFGKPYLEGNPIYFNTTHSQDWMLVAITQDREIGIDIEKKRKDLNIDSIIRDHWTENEKQKWNKLPASDQLDSFFHVWTQKESILKLLGFGLRKDLNLIEVEVNPHHTPKLHNIQIEEIDSNQIQLQTLNIAADYVGTLAAKGLDYKIRYFDGDHFEG